MPKLGTEGTGKTFRLILALRLDVTPLPTPEALLANLLYFIIKVPAHSLPGTSETVKGRRQTYTGQKTERIGMTAKTKGRLQC